MKYINYLIKREIANQLGMDVSHLPTDPETVCDAPTNNLTPLQKGFIGFYLVGGILMLVGFWAFRYQLFFPGAYSWAEEQSLPTRVEYCLRSDFGRRCTLKQQVNSNSTDYKWIRIERPIGSKTFHEVASD